MVAMRKRVSAETPVTAAPEKAQELPPVPEGAGASALAPEGTVSDQGAGDRLQSVPPATSPDNTLLLRLEEQKRAEALQIEAAKAQQSEQKQGLDKSKLSQRDLDFLAMRPGIEQDQRFLQMAAGLPIAGIGYGTEPFYRILAEAFPAAPPQPQEQPQPPQQMESAMPQQPPQFASEPLHREYTDEEIIAEARRIQSERAQQSHLYSAPPSREPISAATGRPTGTRIQLTAQEREMARMLGQSEIEYAKNKARMLAEKRHGLHPDG
jgi:hypothetical protein